MAESERPSMESLTRTKGEAIANKCLVGSRLRTAKYDVPPITRIVEKGMPDVGHMGAYLMGTSGFKNTLNKRHIPKAFQDTIVGDGGFSDFGVFWEHTHLQSVVGIAGDITANGTFILCEVYPYDGIIFPARGLVEKLQAELCLCTGRLGNNQKAARILVYAMYESHGGIVWVIVMIVTQMPRQRIDKRTRVVPASGMHDKSCWLVDHKQVFIFINDVNGNVFCLYVALIARTIKLQSNDVTWLYAIVAFLRPPVHMDKACTCRLLDAVARSISQMGNQKFVHAQELLAAVGHHTEVFVEFRALLFLKIRLSVYFTHNSYCMLSSIISPSSGAKCEGVAVSAESLPLYSS